MPDQASESIAVAVFTALAEENRRAILAALAAGGPATATDLAAVLPISRQGIAKHLARLADAGLVAAEPGERRRIRYRLRSGPMGVAQQFLAALARDWDGPLAALRTHLQHQPAATTTRREIIVMTTVANSEILITGANRGIGQALVDEALRRGAKRVYAGMRVPVDHPEDRVTPLLLDVTDRAQIQRAADQIPSLDILVNNAGVAIYDDLTDPSVIQKHLDVNLYGPLSVAQAVLPLLARSHGAIVNNLSVNGLAAFPLIPGYSVSKAAAFSMTQSLRALCAERGVRVHAVLTGPTNTDMSRGLDAPKATPEQVARAIFDGMESGVDDIFPDPMTEPMADGWRTGVANTAATQFAAMATAIRTAAMKEHAA
jgi:NAD(P)-dependent dehydrogenase (short-subunit alcohol dehydrogenase family)/biotin operon repressor